MTWERKICRNLWFFRLHRVSHADSRCERKTAEEIFLLLLSRLFFLLCSSSIFSSTDTAIIKKLLVFIFTFHFLMNNWGLCFAYFFPINFYTRHSRSDVRHSKNYYYFKSISSIMLQWKFCLVNILSSYLAIATYIVLRYVVCHQNEWNEKSWGCDCLLWIYSA